MTGNTASVKEVNGYGRITTKTTDALGNIIATNDKGGSITFTYNAAGEQIKAQYGENVVIAKYDSWGVNRNSMILPTEYINMNTTDLDNLRKPSVLKELKNLLTII